ncbi:MAG: asparagine synthase (glutamine-hydrolyzing) [Planctomycetota bacterium]|jgi:asparagine synthase (glutamine-hydrolysing)
MCGFGGFALRDVSAAFDQDRLRKMTSAIEHRGPDDEGMDYHDGVAMGFRRLSIIDVDGGHQPIWNEKRTISVTCNGEIYNYRELREALVAKGYKFRSNSDVEVLIPLYEEFGDDFLDELVGMFAICIADFRRVSQPRLLLARDRIGIKPLYWCETKEGLFWGSEPKAILASGAIDRRMRGTALVDYLVQGFTSGPQSAWEGLQRLEAGHCLHWTPAGKPAEPRVYWDLPLEGERESVEPQEILDLVDRVVTDRLVADVPLGAFLSGGIDSTAVVSAMSAAQNKSVLACSIGFEEKSHNELDLAKKTADRLGLEHHTEILQPDPTAAIEHLPWFYDEPLADSSTVPTWLVSRMAREHVTVALSGDGGDEVFGGYRRYVFDVAENKTRQAIGGVGRGLCAGLGALYPKMAWAPRFLRAKSVFQNLGREPGRAYYSSMTQVGLAEVQELLAPSLRDALRDHDPYEAFASHYERPRDCDPLYRAQYADFKTFLPERILMKTDRASMAVGLEVRVPLLDHRFVEAFANLATRHKVQAGRGKHALREALRTRLPGEILDGAKRGFDTPLRKWLQGPMAQAVSEAIEEVPSDVFDNAALRKRLEQHKSGRADHSQLLWSLLIWEHWRRRHGVSGVAV